MGLDFLKEPKMKKLFLTSSFTPVANFLPDFIGEDLVGKTITYISTASVPKKSKFYVKWAKEKLASFGMIVEDLEIGTSSYDHIKEVLEKNDYIFVCGGNPIYLLAKLKETHADELLQAQINAGKVYIGESSGSVVLTKNIEYVLSLSGPEVVEELNNYDALDLIDFYPVPHYQTFPFVQRVEEIMNHEAQKIPLAPITNNQVILVQGSNYEIKTALIK